MEKMTFFGFAADNHVPETTRIPVYMGVQPIKLKNIFPPYYRRQQGWIHTVSYEHVRCKCPKMLIWGHFGGVKGIKCDEIPPASG